MYRMRSRHHGSLGILLTILLLVGGFPLPAQEPAVEIRAIWVTRWDYSSPRDVAAIMDDVASAGFNVVLWQVRGNGTVFYRSDIEPWAWELTGSDPTTLGVDPGWDPLAVALDEAHRRGLELHAYFNVLPAWRGQNFPPANSGQLWWSRPGWFMCDASGRRMVPQDHHHGNYRDWYTFLSPGHPQVRDYLASLVGELATRYELDGIHFDYIRYPAEIRDVEEPFKERAARMGNWSYDPVSLARFTLETGLAGPDADPDAWTEWRVAQVTETVRRMRAAALAARPGLVLSAAVMPSPAEGRASRYQDYMCWLDLGLLDMVVAMNYTNDPAIFRDRASVLVASRPETGHVVTGVGTGYGTQIAASEIAIAREAGLAGVSCFAYRLLFGELGKPRPPRPLAELMRQEIFAERAITPWRQTAELKAKAQAAVAAAPATPSPTPTPVDTPAGDADAPGTEAPAAATSTPALATPEPPAPAPATPQ